ncbi:MAG: 4Fe-4S dicluster domain-containing protein [Promethearchaeota archaeon]|nr:MAG: 4Fe-4S dicluster domain-containing protein [Candidatus Lokiarchaeota archaeon]
MMKITPYEIDEVKYERFDEKNNMIYRSMWDNSLPTHRKMFFTNIEKHIELNKEGYTRFDFAFVKAAWTVYKKFPFAFAWKGDSFHLGDFYGTNWTKPKYKIDNLSEFTYKVKKVVKFYGASLVGVTDIDERWIYKTGFNMKGLTSDQMSKGGIRAGEEDDSILKKPINLPDGINKAIVMAIEMNPEAIATAPAQPAAASAANAYSRMAFILSCVGEFIRNLGYRAIQCGNDTALSIPLAIDAGIGALGRIGLLITSEYGPRVRICKVFTDLPLESDAPNIEFIENVNNTCKNCFKCAEECENQAISLDNEPSFRRNSISNNSAVRKYYVNVEKCFEFWVENSSDCGKCIAVCPYSKIEKAVRPNEFWSDKYK